ncbi:hypothetical protein [Actinomadura sp. NEAU-AAG7]|uniref:hypothetical protein n=1 Tax=Actinomadura sp. NEAU-AAG7 TaxID=2839640 RepID=UPI001BE3D28B|nr:hypothetical protein [Actinomadura sp. NEAU-AAG7]MBT2212430.1 hypothetical protein [Actinomadura sp. NEAU-AAG7]
MPTLPIASALAAGPDRSIAFVYGTRPGQIKLSVLINLLGDHARLVHTGQHYDPDLDTRTGDLPPPHLRLAVGGRTRGVQIGAATASLTRTLPPPRPAWS